MKILQYGVKTTIHVITTGIRALRIILRILKILVLPGTAKALARKNLPAKQKLILVKINNLPDLQIPALKKLLFLSLVTFMPMESILLLEISHSVYLTAVNQILFSIILQL